MKAFVILKFEVTELRKHDKWKVPFEGSVYLLCVLSDMWHWSKGLRDIQWIGWGTRVCCINTISTLFRLIHTVSDSFERGHRQILFKRCTCTDRYLIMYWGWKPSGKGQRWSGTKFVPKKRSAHIKQLKWSDLTIIRSHLRPLLLMLKLFGGFQITFMYMGNA